MITANKKRIRALFLVGYTDTLRGVRRGVKGLRIPHFFCIMLIGDTPTAGPRACDLAALAGMSNSNVTHRLNTGIDAGYIYKENKRYYLTSSGRLAYEAMCREYDVTMNEILRELLKEAQRRVK